MCTQRKSRDAGVSPVVGVMLMLVVTIIIAAVVSAFAGGLSTGQKKAPAISVESHIVNDGTWGGSYYDFSILSVDTAVPTKDLKIITSWKASDGTKGGVTVTGPNMTETSLGNTYYGSATGAAKRSHAPYGFGPGVNQSVTISSQGPGGNFYPDQMFGNYSLTGGTRMHNGPCSNYGKLSLSPAFTYTGANVNYDPDTQQDAVQAVLGKEWYKLRMGDIVNVKFVHIPSGKVIYDKEITVED